MRYPTRLPLALVGTALLLVPSVNAAETPAARNWPAWRGPLANGIAPHADPPTTWSDTQNVRWKVTVPGRGTSTPVIWEDQVFLLTAIPKGAPTPGTAGRPDAATPPPGTGGGRGNVEQPSEEHRFTVISFDRGTGKTRWQHTARTALPHEGHHKDHGYASGSPVTDGEVLIATFGSRGLHAYDLKGTPLWQKDLGRMRTRNNFGEGSSPALHGDRVLVLWDHEDEDFIVALDRRTGRELWRQQRDEPTGWTTPLVVSHGGGHQVIVNGANRVRSYDVATGELLWQAGGQTGNAIPTPVADPDRVYVTSGWRGAACQAITLGRRGELTGTDAILWTHNRSTPYVPSPLLHGDLLYFFAGNNAQLSILDAKTGQPHLEAERLEGLFGIYASPVVAANRVYVVGRDGGTWVLRHGSKLEVLAKNKLDDGFEASPALVGNELFLRGQQHLYCLAENR